MQQIPENIGICLIESLVQVFYVGDGFIDLDPGLFDGNSCTKDSPQIALEDLPVYLPLLEFSAQQWNQAVVLFCKDPFSTLCDFLIQLFELSFQLVYLEVGFPTN
jgi:hypothetical protein